jgi:hypothetical protein
MGRSVERVRKALQFREPERLPRSELWINSNVLEWAQMEDTLKGHLTLRNQLGMDLLFLPLSATETYRSSQGYRYFSLEDVQEALKQDELFVAVIIDGPFQRIVEQRGLITVLSALKQNREIFFSEYRREAEIVRDLIRQCLELGVELFVIADDLAYERSTYFSPKDAEDFLVPFYSESTESIHAGGAFALFHSCGNIEALVPKLLICAIDGLAAWQARCFDVISVRREHPSGLILLGGIEPQYLDSEILSEEQQREFHLFVREISKGGGFMLCSSSGLYKPELVDRIHLLYRLTEDRPEEREHMGEHVTSKKISSLYGRLAGPKEEKDD